MAEKLKLEEFYEETIPTAQSVEEIYNASRLESSFTNKDEFIFYTNKLFGMLAHLKVTSLTAENLPKLAPLIVVDSYSDFMLALIQFKIAKSVPNSDDYSLNPSAIPMIQKYIKIFDVYEKQNGIVNPYTRKSSKEPLDNE